MNIVNTLDWMLNHKGVAVARIVNDNKNTIEIIKYTECEEEYPELKEYAKTNNYVVVVGKVQKEENRLGYLRC